MDSSGVCRTSSTTVVSEPLELNREHNNQPVAAVCREFSYVMVYYQL